MIVKISYLAVALRIWGGVIILFLALPIFILIPLSFTDQASFAFPPHGWSLRWYENFLSSAEWRSSLVNSLIVAFLSALFATAIGTAATIGMERLRFRVRIILLALLLTPLLFPRIVIAIAIYASYIRIGVSGTLLGFVLAHTVMALPFVVLAVSANLRVYDHDLDLAADSLGASVLVRFFRVTLPLILPGVLSGAVFAFVTSLDETVVALFLKSPTVETLPVKMYSSVTVSVDPSIAVASTIILAITTALLLVPQMFLRTKKR